MRQDLAKTNTTLLNLLVEVALFSPLTYTPRERHSTWYYHNADFCSFWSEKFGIGEPNSKLCFNAEGNHSVHCLIGDQLFLFNQVEVVTRSN